MTENTINADVTMDGGAAGTLLAGRYRVVRQLGQGGMGSVWLAEDLKLDGHKVAVKMLPSILVSNKRAYNQLKSEALVALKLTHPNIATVRAFEENEGNPFLVMDYIDGLTLDEYLAKKGKLSEETTYCLLEPVARALDYAHERGIVHRDVKPGNVMVTWDGDPFVLDFGIAREIQETMTRVTGKLSSGTLLYMSPEQLKGASPKSAQDVYSFAALAYECLKGEPPFCRGQVEWQILNGAPEPLPAGIAMGPRVMAGLAKKPEDRPPSCLAIMRGGWKPSDAGETHEAKPKAEAEETTTSAPRTEAPKAVAPATEAESPLVAQIRERWKLLALVGVSLLTVIALVSSRSTASSPSGRSAPAGAVEAGDESKPEEKPKGIDAKYVDVGVLVGRVERLDRADGFAAKIDALVDVQNRARSHYELQQWTAAAKLFDEAEAAAKGLLELGRLREQAKSAAHRADKAATGAEAANARQLAAALWNQAVEERDRAKGEFGTQRFTDATERYDRAEKLFADAEKTAIDEAARRKIPTLKLVTKVGGREVMYARIHIGDREYVSPVSFGQVRKNDTFGPFSVSYVENYRLYEGSFKAVTVDWEGAKTYVFDLKEHVFPKPGTRKVVTLDASGTTMAFRWCPAGEFMMGSPRNESGRDVDESQHLVKLMRGFWMGETEVTQGQWKRLMDGDNILDQARRALYDDTIYNFNGKEQTLRELWKADRDADTTQFCGDTDDDAPVYYVSWDEAVEFCRRLTARERVSGHLPSGYEYRLPTEAEWEYACRAGTSTTLPNGRDFVIVGKNNAPALDDIAWYGGNSSMGFSGRGWDTDGWEEKQYSGGRAAPRRVRGKRANSWNIFDMLGNVNEWCGDWYGSNLSDATNPTGCETGNVRVMRGGYWCSVARACRPAYRMFKASTFRDNYLGFRVALAPIYEGYPYGAAVEAFSARSRMPEVRTQLDEHSKCKYTMEQDIERRMKKMRLPMVSFKPPATIIDAVDFFRSASKDYDRPEIPIEKRGFNFILKMPQALAAQMQAVGKADMAVLPMITMSDISVYEALTSVCNSVGYKFIIRGSVVWVMPKDMDYLDAQ